MLLPCKFQTPSYSSGRGCLHDRAMAGRIVRNRCVVLVGKTGTGMSTVANHLVGHDPLSPDEPPFRASGGDTSVTLKVQHETVEFVWENNLYRVTVVDTPGTFQSHRHRSDIFNEIEKYIKQHFLRIDFILFVCKKSVFTKEEQYSFSVLFSFIRKRLCIQDIVPISALVITQCEHDNTHAARKQVVQLFCHNHREIASQMGMGIYPVGFPPVQYMETCVQQIYKQQMVKDRDTLRGLIVQVNAERERGE